jgi:hypothetical protein
MFILEEKKMMNRKGFLLGEFTLKVILSVVSIIILGALLFGIYGIFAGNAEVKSAEGTLDRIVNGFEELEEGEFTSLILVEPVDSDFIVDYKTCFSDCLCLEVNRVLNFGDKVVCKNLDKEIEIEKDLRIGGSTVVGFRGIEPMDVVLRLDKNKYSIKTKENE